MTLPLTDLTAMAANQVAHMYDTCHRLTRTGTVTTSYGQPKDTWSEVQTDIPCGLDTSPGSLNYEADKPVTTWDATIRVPLGTTLKQGDRVKITKRFGQSQSSPITYDVVSPAQQGPTALRFHLQEVQV